MKSPKLLTPVRSPLPSFRHLWWLYFSTRQRSVDPRLEAPRGQIRLFQCRSRRQRGTDLRHAARRRVTFTAQRALDGGANGQGIHFGYKEHSSDTIVNIASCAILLPSLETEISLLRDLCKTLLRGNEEIQFSVNLCDNGFDLDFHLPQPPNETMTAGFVRAMAKSSFLRGSIDGDIVIEKEKPLIRFGRAEVAVPPGGFLQAVEAAETEMFRLVCQHLNGRKRVVDLFSGSGTFALRLAERSCVHAVELEKAALAALQSASHVEGLKSIGTENP